jgi:hypothetical protein
MYSRKHNRTRQPQFAAAEAALTVNGIMRRSAVRCAAAAGVARRAVTAQDCALRVGFMYGSANPTMDKVGQFLQTDTALDCCQRCGENEQCAFFTFWPDKAVCCNMLQHDMLQHVAKGFHTVSWVTVSDAADMMQWPPSQGDCILHSIAAAGTEAAAAGGTIGSAPKSSSRGQLGAPACCLT